MIAIDASKTLDQTTNRVERIGSFVRRSARQPICDKASARLKVKGLGQLRTRLLDPDTSIAGEPTIE